MLTNKQMYVDQVTACWASALDVQKNKFIKNDYLIATIQNYFKNNIEKWIKRGDELEAKNASQSEWDGWIKGGEIHSSACKDWGAYSPGVEILTATWTTIKEAPKFVKEDVKKGAQVAAEFITDAASGAAKGLVEGGAPLIIIGLVLIVGLLYVKSKV